MMSKTYLGNGLYAEWDGEQLLLWTERENGQPWLKTLP